MNKMLLVQYAKWPELSKVKTRIGRIWGDERALDIHMELVQDILCRFVAQPDSDYQLWLDRLPTNLEHFDQRSKQASGLLQGIIDQKGIVCATQQGTNLGERMNHSFRYLLREYEQVAIIGSDCPNVQTADLQDVSDALVNYDVVIIPAEDGGYVLLAMRSEALLNLTANWLGGVNWGSRTALAETIKCCQTHQLSVSLLSESWDVDEVQDYQRWKSLPS